MGYCGIKIPGHSETDFKHRKAFTNRKKILKINSELNLINARVEEREKYQPNTWVKYMRMFIAIIFMFIILFLMYGFLSRVVNVSIHKSQISEEYLQGIKTKEDVEVAQMLYKSAKSYYEEGSLDPAQSEITRVLKLYPTHNQALNLMHQILEKQCEVNNKYCRQAKEYRDYLALKIE